MTVGLVLGAGRGSRLSPLTDDRPKCMVPFLGRPLFEWQLDALAIAGVQPVNLVTGYRADAFDPYSVETWHNPNWDSTNMIASLMCARGVLEQARSDVVVAYSDLVYEPRLIESLIATAGDIVLTIDRGWEALWRARMDNPYDDAESLRVDATGQVTDLGQKITGPADVEGQYTGLIKVSPTGAKALLAFWDAASERPDWALGRTKPNAYMTDLLRGMIQSGHPVMASFVEHGWFEVDTVEDLRRYEAAAEAEDTTYMPDLRWSAAR